MSTLHQYRWFNLDHCKQRLDLIEAEDTLLIYGEFTAQDQQQFIAATELLDIQCHWLNESPQSSPGITNINYQQWLTLIAEHDKTHTWK
ncbi:MAG: hypothetical protein DWP95_06570 [Proteobacteria bacterium]|nr:MAG: hypothetical protein DWP95_06570 [Pseudomonadota bacterium]